MLGFASAKIELSQFSAFIERRVSIMYFTTIAIASTEFFRNLAFVMMLISPRFTVAAQKFSSKSSLHRSGRASRPFLLSDNRAICFLAAYRHYQRRIWHFPSKNTGNPIYTSFISLATFTVGIKISNRTFQSRIAFPDRLFSDVLPDIYRL